MKLIVLAFGISVVTAGTLTNTYLPPAGARTDGISSSLETPIHTNRFGDLQSGSLAARSFHQQDNIFGSSDSDSIDNYNTPALVYGAPDASDFKNTQQFYSAPVHIVRFNNENKGDGTYQFEYETDNKISLYEQGQLRNSGTDHESNLVQGSFSYAAPDGQVFTVNYIADEHGFQPVGDHLPTPPPIPVAIQKSLLINAADDSANSRTGDQPEQTYEDWNNRQHNVPKTFSSPREYHY